MLWPNFAAILCFPEGYSRLWYQAIMCATLSKDMAVAVTNAEKDVKGYVVDMQDRLGQSSSALVCKAKKCDDDVIAATKIINQPEIVERAKDVYDVLSERHNNVIYVFDIHKEESKLYIFMELCLYDLRGYFENEVPIKTKLLIDQQIANGLDFLHSKRIVHRDMKPENILVKDIADGIPRIKITDFELSKHIVTCFETQVLRSSGGTFAYRAPEFWMGKREYLPNVDTYSTGIIFLAIKQHKLPVADRMSILRPRLETNMDESEIYNPIGGTIYERIKYKLTPLSIAVENEKDGPEERAMTKLINKMTEAHPSNRISVRQVIDELGNIIQVIGHDSIQISNL